MFRQKWMAKAMLITVLLAMITGCSSPTPTPAPTEIPQPTVNVQATMIAVQTQAVKTFSTNLTQNAPTATVFVPTKTTAPTATAAVTNTPLLPIASATATLKPQPVGPTSTVAVNCTIKQAYPSAADTFTPGAEFTARWVVANTGITTWVQGGFEIIYWSGARFEGQSKFSMPFDVGKNSDITLVTAKMKAPSAAGTYKSVWAVVKGFTPYCLMPLTVIAK